MITKLIISNTKQKLLYVAIAAVLFGGGTPLSLSAEESAPQGNEMVLDEVVVTARRIEENLQETPVSVAVLTAEDMEVRGIDNVSEIAHSTPNVGVQTAPNGGSSTANFFIRGIGQFDFISTMDPGVALYLDGVYIGRSVGAALDVVDFDQIEVLRGPQGTLFGRNTPGGAINIRTKKPEMEQSGHVEFTGGSYDRTDFKAVFNTPLADGVAVRLTAAKNNRNGYVKNRFLGIDTGEIDTTVLRADVLWEPNDDFSLRVTVDSQTKDGVGGPESADAFDTGPGTNVGAYNDLVLAPQGLPLIGSNFLDASPYVSFNGEKSIDEYDIFGLGVTAEWAFDAATFRSITGYRTLESRNAYDFDGTPYPLIEQEISLDQQQFSQEFQLFGTAMDDRLKWIGGLYYFHEKNNEKQVVDFWTGVTAIGDGGFVSSGTSAFPTFPGIGPFVNTPEPETDSYALFAEGQWAFTDNFDVTLGARFTKEEKKYASQVSGATVRPRSKQRADWTDLSPRVVARYHIGDNMMVYGSVSKGFRSGGSMAALFPLHCRSLTIRKKYWRTSWASNPICWMTVCA